MADLDAAVIVISNLSSVITPLLIGHLLNGVLYGVLTVQVYLYYVSFPGDSCRMKIVVALVYLLETTQLIIASYDAFRMFSINWGNPEGIDDMGLLWLSMPVLIGMISCLSQMFYCWRIYGMSQNRLLAGTIVLFSLVPLVSGICNGVLWTHMERLSDVRAHTFKTAVTFMTLVATGEVLITASMVFYLRKAKRSTYVKCTTSLLANLIKLTVETGFICAAAEISAIVLFITSPDTTYYILVGLMASKLFSNCFLAVLNSRIHIVGGRNSSERDAEMREGVRLEPLDFCPTTWSRTS
ncbi:hypothetical protein BXZ70DRAFT_499772 [Cristinia sonorae]|uniref:DUF6534 domain-containing protein n=1 Tax=Cristinia sonorae TaxID=1940300 RepID=A0A8K0UHH6_9AGAR|nr:hypothetical protein BXZ70DRAFT_499772 [Cristinia sonorae]